MNELEGQARHVADRMRATQQDWTLLAQATDEPGGQRVAGHVPAGSHMLWLANVATTRAQYDGLVAQAAELERLAGEAIVQAGDGLDALAERPTLPGTPEYAEAVRAAERLADRRDDAKRALDTLTAAAPGDGHADYLRRVDAGIRWTLPTLLSRAVSIARQDADREADKLRDVCLRMVGAALTYHDFVSAADRLTGGTVPAPGLMYQHVDAVIQIAESGCKVTVEMPSLPAEPEAESRRRRVR